MRLIQSISRGTSFQGFPKESYDGELFLQLDTKKMFKYSASTHTWEELSLSSLSSQSETSTKPLTAQICTQCGAPLHGNRCEYLVNFPSDSEIKELEERDEQAFKTTI